MFGQLRIYFFSLPDATLYNILTDPVHIVMELWNLLRFPWLVLQGKGGADSIMFDVDRITRKIQAESCSSQIDTNNLGKNL